MVENLIRLEELRLRHLVFTHDGMPGYHRQRSGKGFRYLTPEGVTLRDRSERSRIASLVIPPAYESVWVSIRANGHLQATGIDQRGRKQYRYHPDWHLLAADRKFEVLPAFAMALPRIRRRVRAALSGDELDKDRIIAGIVALLDATGFRVGNRRYVKENKSFGLSSLLSRHLFEEDGQWVIRFKGKSGKEHRADVADAKLVSLISELQDLPGQHLFQWEDAAGELRPVETADVNAWLKEVSDGDFTAKQFRTWRATLLCARELGKLPPEESQAALKRAEVAAIRYTAEALNHTVATCRKYYVHPGILKAFRGGELHRVMNSKPPRLRRADESARLNADERRVLSLIERFPVRARKKAARGVKP
ncbi:DNA topoisomerase IB [Luteolibacter luteus]|uniref:DNA topoisomerase IB n=1 Tax=Luteolibacter luteus TaxID=2728835 RepID=A0A858RGL1_9BACT|nr:DNA topoisomerase IB [Luteolibacter luteus]QJE95668.1 DNA topoisomerase IB [Luteolibacter luteus]